MHSLLHDIPRYFILFLDELFLIFNQMLSIRAFGRRVVGTQKNRLNEHPKHMLKLMCKKILTILCSKFLFI